MDYDNPPNAATGFLLRLPIIGYAARCAASERWSELAFLVANVVMALVLAVLIWGLPALHAVALAGAALMFVVLIAITSG